MTFEIIIQIILLGVALSMDAFAVSICDGLIYTDLNKKKGLFISSCFGLFQGVMPLIGFFIANLFYDYIKDAIPWIAFGLLLIIGGKMVVEGILSIRKTEDEKEAKKFSYKEVLIQGVATSIDALAVGVTLLSYSTTQTVWLHAGIITIITFLFCIVGLLLGKMIYKLLKGKYEIANIIGGCSLILLGVWIVLSHYLGI